jgi:hypothetical protein
VRAIAWLVVAAISAVSGGFSIPIGFALGLSGLEVYLAATIGSMTGLFVFLYAGDKVRTKLTAGRADDAAEPSGAARRFVDRYGVKGLGLVGPIFPGVTASVLIGLGLGMKRGDIARWMSVGIAVMFALYCVGLWALVEVIGVD